MREAPCGLGTAIPYCGQPLQPGKNTTVILVPHKVLAETLTSTSSFRDVKHLSATSSLSPERLRSSTNLLRGGLPVSAIPMEVLAPCSFGQGADRKPGLRASSMHLAACALDAEAYIFIANLSGSLEKLTQPKKTLENPAE